MRHVTTDDYGVEVVLDMPNGMQLRADGEDATGTSYVRVCDPNGQEIAYWVCDEWREDPEVVMGAIIGALCAVEYAPETPRAVVRRTFFGGKQDQSYEDWADWTVQDGQVAYEIAQAMLKNDGSYEYGSPMEPEFYEEFEILDRHEFERQMTQAYDVG